ncbi:MAG: glycosyltransferase family 4 protein [Candidatus Moranbacteria bacterium]|nr:glycosyltransferase family 4 protein [Candidatus Moranbacteria bacterium]
MKNLALFFTYGISLEDWFANGNIDRELNIYKRFLNHFNKIYFITYGIDDLKFQDALPKNIIILQKKYPIPNPFYSLLIPFAHKKQLRNCYWLKTNQMLGSWSAVLAKIFFQKKLVIRTGYTESLFGRKGIKKFLTRIFEHIAYKFSDVSIVTTKAQADYIQKKYKTKNIFVIPNSIDTELFRPIEKNNSLGGPIRILFVGRLNREKNIFNLLRALSGLRGIKLKIVGKGELENEILQLAKKLSLDLELIGNIPNSELPKIYNEADIYMQPSLYEGNPKAILEAMSCGLPVIASNIEGINNLIIDSVNGLLCGTDTTSIASKLNDLLNNKPLKEKIASNARNSIRNTYSIEKIMRNELTLYK